MESMQVGEMADLKCAPEFAYGQHGSPPSIPPNATLTRDTLSKPRHSLRPAGSPQALRRLSAGFFQRPITPEAARSFGQPRPISRVGRGRFSAGHRALGCVEIALPCSRDRFEIELLDFHSISIGEIVLKNGAYLL